MRWLHSHLRMWLHASACWKSIWWWTMPRFCVRKFWGEWVFSVFISLQRESGWRQETNGLHLHHASLSHLSLCFSSFSRKLVPAALGFLSKALLWAGRVHKPLCWGVGRVAWWNSARFEIGTSGLSASNLGFSFQHYPTFGFVRKWGLAQTCHQHMANVHL